MGFYNLIVMHLQSLFSPECSVPMDYYTKWSLMLSFPAMFLLLFAILFLIAHTVSYILRRYDHKRYLEMKVSTVLEPTNRVKAYVKGFSQNMIYRLRHPILLTNTFINALLMVMSLMYTFVTSKSFEFFSCTKQNDGSYSLDASPGHQIPAI